MKADSLDHLYTERKWRRLRLQFLAEHPLCRMCAARGYIVEADVVDHIRPHRGDLTLFWSWDNWQGLCRMHHDRTKKAQERSGFSREIGLDGFPVDRNHPFHKRP